MGDPGRVFECGSCAYCPSRVPFPGSDHAQICVFGPSRLPFAESEPVISDRLPDRVSIQLRSPNCPGSLNAVSIPRGWTAITSVSPFNTIDFSIS